MARTPEGAVKKDVAVWLKAKQAWSFRPVSNGMGQHGIPDIIACIPITITPDMVGRKLGLFAGIETKAPGRRLDATPLQAMQIAAITKANGFACVVDRVSQLDPIMSGFLEGADHADQTE